MARGDKFEKKEYSGAGGDRYEGRGERGGDDDRGGRRGGGSSSGGGGFHRKKVCRFCADTDFIMDYKDIRMMQSFVTEHGKIVPRRISGNCAQHQRKLTTAVKRARNIAIVGYISSGA